MSHFLELEDREKEFMGMLLSERLGDLRDQIYKTDSSAFREGLKEEELMLRRLIDKLGRGVHAQEGEHRVERGPIEKAG